MSVSTLLLKQILTIELRSGSADKERLKDIQETVHELAADRTKSDRHQTAELNANHTEPSAAETPMARVGTGLDTLTTFLQPLLQEHLRTHLDNLPRITDDSNAFHGCLADRAGEPLLHDLGTGAELCNRSLPTYEQKTMNGGSTTKTIPVMNEHELAYLYLPEWYKHNIDLTNIFVNNLFQPSQFIA